MLKKLHYILAFLLLFLNQFSFAKGRQNPFRNTSIIGFALRHLYRDIYRYCEGINFLLWYEFRVIGPTLIYTSEQHDNNMTKTLLIEIHT